MSSQTLTKENLSETFVREQHGDVPSVDYNLDDHSDSFSSTLLDAPSVPGRMSPVPSEDPTMKPLKAEYSGGSNYKTTTIQANVANVQFGYVKEKHSPMGNGGTPDQVTYIHPVMENADQEQSTGNGRRSGSESRQMKLEMVGKKCCAVHVVENSRLNLSWEQRCKNAEKQVVDKQKECEDLQKQLYESRQEAVDLYNNQCNIIHVTNQQIASMQSNIFSMEVKKAHVEKQFAELQQQLKNMTEDYHRALDEKDAFLEKIVSQVETMVELEQKFKNMEETHRREQVEERNAFMTKMNDLNEEKNSLEEKTTELEQEHEQLKTQLETALATIEADVAEREATTTQTSILRLSNELLQHKINQLDTILQASEGRQQDDQASRDEIRRIVEGLRFPQQLRQPDNDGNRQLPIGPVIVQSLRSEVEYDVHEPNSEINLPTCIGGHEW